MSRREKLLSRIFSEPYPKDVRFEDLQTALEGFGFELFEQKGGSSHKYFVRQEGDDVQRINTSRPHPSGIMKRYQLKEIHTRLKEWGLL